MKLSRMQQEHIKRLEWAVLFCQQDLSKCREGDWLNLRDDMWSFVNQGQSLDREWFADNATNKKLIEIQEDLKRELTSLAVDPRKTHADKTVGIGPMALLVSVLAPSVDEPFVQVLESELDLTLTVAASLCNHLTASGIVRSQLRVCPQCDTLFLSKRKPREDKQLHCSIQCSRLAATHRYRKKQKAEMLPKERERSHKRYVEKVRRNHGPKTKVRRIPRKSNKVRQ